MINAAFLHRTDLRQVGLLPFTVSLWLVTTMGHGAYGSSANPNIAEQFKAFIASPPVIEELVWERKLGPPAREAADRLDISASTNYQRYIARWQPNGRSIYQVLPQNVTTNLIMNWYSVSVFEKKQWHLVPEGILTFWYDDQAPANPKAEPNVVPGGVFSLSYRLAEVINMGVFNVAPGGIHWEGDSFSATNSKYNIRFSGKLILTGAGIPEKLQFQTRFGTNSENYELHYSFDRNVGLAYIPSQIRCIDHVSGNVRERALFNIQSVKLAAEQSDEAAFLPRTNFVAIPIEHRLYTNAANYAFGSDGKLVHAPLSRAHTHNDSKRRIYLGICGVITFAIFALMLGAKAREPNKTVSY